MKLFRLFSSVICLMFVNNAIANTDLVKNLKDRVNPFWYNKEILQANIQTAAQKAGPNPYLLSFPLVAGAQLGDEIAYSKYISPMITMLDKMPTTQNSLRAWLYGRALFATDSIGDKNLREIVRKKLTILLKDPSTAQDRFSAWAWGYAASLDKKSYFEAKPELEKALKHLTADPQVAKSDKLWAWLMAAYDAAEVSDFAFYQVSFQTIKEIAHEVTVAESLSKGLVRTAVTNDFPAWGLALALLASATMKDEIQYQELKRAFAVSLQGAKDTGALGEEMLGEVNAELALVRYKN